MRLVTKVAAVTSGVIFLSASVRVALTEADIERQLMAELRRSTDAALEGYAESLPPGALARRDERALLPVLLEARRRLDAEFVAVVDPAGRAVAHSDVSKTGTRPPRPEDGPPAAASWNGRRVLLAAIPVRRRTNDAYADLAQGDEDADGRLVAAVPLADLDALRARLRRGALLIQILAAAAVVATLVLLLRAILAPIRPLLEAAARIGRGERGVAVRVTRDDELGELCAGFNAMARSLDETTVSRNALDAILSSLRDPLVITDASGLIGRGNPALEKLLGLNQAQLRGRSVSGLGDGFPADLAAAADGRGDREVRLRGATGGETVMLLGVSAVRSREGETQSYILTLRDISERKRLESRMIQSEKLSAVGQLAAGVAHEINNPMGVILGFAQSVLKRMEPEHPWREPLSAIERESRRCKALVQNLLTFSRQRKETTGGSYDLRAAVDEARTLVEAQAKIKSVRLEFIAPAEPVRVTGDVQHAQQIVINLCTNAIDAVARDGRVLVRVSSAEHGGRRWARLEVHDDGPGVPAGLRKKVFEPFFTTKEPGKGTGLGLALVSELTQRYEGHVDIDSAPGWGTIFRVELPASLDEPPAGGAPSS